MSALAAKLPPFPSILARQNSQPAARDDIPLRMTNKLIGLFLLASTPAFAMPCDISALEVHCKSVGGKYSFATTTCGFDQDLRGATLSIAGEKSIAQKVEDQWFGKKFFAVQFDLSDPHGDLERRVSFEWSTVSGKGTVTEEQRNFDPAPWKSVTVPVTCTIKDASNG
jgi:hypothetical protein